MRLLLLAATALYIFSCQEAPREEAPLVKAQTLVALPLPPEKIKGIYSGSFKGSPISLVLNFVSHRHASGYNVHKGLTRNLSGTVEFRSGRLHLSLAEPGNNIYDGQFDLEIDTARWT